MYIRAFEGLRLQPYSQCTDKGRGITADVSQSEHIKVKSVPRRARKCSSEDV